MKKPNISIIITTYERPIPLTNLLTDFQKQRYNVNKFEIIVFNDGGNKSIERIVKRFPNLHIKYFSSDQRRFGAFGRNIGMKHSSGSILVFLDDDVRINPDFLTKVDLYADTYNAFCFRIESPLKISPLKKLIGSWLLGKSSLMLGMMFGFFQFDSKKTVRVSHFPGCFFCCKKKLTAGLYWDEDIAKGTGYFDDFVFSNGMHKRGTHLVYIGGESIKHMNSNSGGYREKNPEQFYYFYFNHKAFILKNYSHSIFLITAFIPCLIEATLISIYLRSNIIFSFLHGWIDGKNNIQKT